MDALATSLPCCRCVRCKIRIECEPIYFWMRVQLCMCSSIVLYIGRLSLVLNSARSGRVSVQVVLLSIGLLFWFKSGYCMCASLSVCCSDCDVVCIGYEL